jgi:drug/metabolite transporter (DMT)-like permease
MFFLVLCILSSTLIFISFRYFETFRINIFNAIIVNYFTASSLAFILISDSTILIPGEFSSWMTMALLLGILFVIIFYLIAITTQEVGIAVSSIACKMSMILPILFSILYYNENVSGIKIAGIILAPAGVVLSVIKKDISLQNKKFIVLPLVMFLGVGITDSLVKYAQQDHLNNVSILQFSAYLFLISFISSFIFKFIRGFRNSASFSKKDILGGIFLGLANFSSLFFFILALRHSGIDSSLVFGINSIGIVLLSVLSGIILFHEKLTKINWAGIITAVISLVIFLNV